MRDPFEGMTFAPDAMPPPEEGPEALRPLEIDCCTDPECVSRDWQRAVSLLMDRLTQAYCAMQLVRWHTGEVWPCDGREGACTDSRCRFGKRIEEYTAVAERSLTATIVDAFESLSITAADLRGEWHGLTEAELAKVGISDLLLRFGTGAITEEQLARDASMFLEHFREEVVAHDRDAYIRWFEPPTHPARPR